MYERFTDRARKAMQVANQEAQRFNQEYIGTEHILLGVLQNEGVATAVLKNLDVDRPKIRSDIEKLVERGPEAVTIGKLPQTPRAKKVLEFAMLEARNLYHNYVGDEHLLLGLLRETEGIAANVLANSGLKLTEVREEILNLLGHVSEHEPEQRLTEAEVLTREKRERVTRSLSRILSGKPAEDPHRFHPQLRPLLDQIRILDLQKHAAASDLDLETAAALRDRQRRVQQISATLRERLTDAGRGTADYVERLCVPLPAPPSPTIREAEAEQIIKLLARGETVLVVAPRGAGKSVLFQTTSRILSRGVPEFESSAPLLVHPNFLQIRQESRVVKDVPLLLMQQLLRDNRHLLTIAEVDACCSDRTSAALAESWKRAFRSADEHRRPLLLGCTDAGLAKLTAVWPGLVSQWRIVQLRPLVFAETNAALQNSLNSVCAAHGWFQLRGLPEALISAASGWAGADLADPGRSLLLLARLVARVAASNEGLAFFCIEGETIDAGGGPSLIEKLTLQKEEAVAAQDFEAAATLLDRIKILVRKARPSLGPETVARFLALEPTCP